MSHRVLYTVQCGNVPRKGPDKPLFNSLNMDTFPWMLRSRGRGEFTFGNWLGDLDLDLDLSSDFDLLSVFCK